MIFSFHRFLFLFLVAPRPAVVSAVRALLRAVSFRGCVSLCYGFLPFPIPFALHVHVHVHHAALSFAVRSASRPFAFFRFCAAPVFDPRFFKKFKILRFKRY